MTILSTIQTLKHKHFVKIPTLKNGFLDKQRATDIYFINNDGTILIVLTIDNIKTFYKKSVKLIKLLEQSEVVLGELPRPKGQGFSLLADKNSIMDYFLQESEFISEERY